MATCTFEQAGTRVTRRSTSSSNLRESWSSSNAVAHVWNCSDLVMNVPTPVLHSGGRGPDEAFVIFLSLFT
jgi:hypothetical protein